MDNRCVNIRGAEIIEVVSSDDSIFGYSLFNTGQLIGGKGEKGDDEQRYARDGDSGHECDEALPPPRAVHNNELPRR